MKITAIKQQVKRTNRYSIFIDDKYKFSLSDIEVSNLGVHVGQSISGEELASLNKESETSLAKNNSLRFLSYRPRSRWEMESYLKRKKYEPETVDKTIKFLEKNNFIDDQKFAQLWVENRLLLKHVSVKQLRQELKLKRINNEIIEKVLVDQEIDEVAILKELIEKKREQSKYKDDLKLMQYLARRGYSYDNIQVALGRRSS